MTDTVRTRESLNKLLKIARADAEALRTDLADVERAKASAEASRQALDETMREEEVSARAGDTAAFAAYVEGVRARRHNLQTTLMTLQNAEEGARDKLETSFIEIQKLEHLIGVNERAEKKSAGRREIAAADESFAARIKAS